MGDTATIAMRTISEDTTSRWLEAPQHKVSQVGHSDTSTPDTTRYWQMATQLPKAQGIHRDALRNALISAVRNPPLLEPPAAYISAVLDGLLASKQPGRLDEAIDILACAGPEVERFAIDAARSVRPSDEHDDFWFVVVQALGRVTATGAPHSLVEWALSSDRRQLIEAGISVLGERADEGSKKRLGQLATEHPSVFVRDLAGEALEDWSK